MNTQISKEQNNKFSLPNSSIDFSLENKQTCLNTKFQKRKGNLWTNSYPNYAKAKIDYILINKEWINSALNC